jgi:hypothetical protein
MSTAVSCPRSYCVETDEHGVCNSLERRIKIGDFQLGPGIALPPDNNANDNTDFFNGDVVGF